MKKRIAYIMIAFFLVLALTPSTYAKAADDVRTLSLAEATEMAIKKSSSLKQADYDIERGEEVRESISDKLSYIPSGPTPPEVSAVFTTLIASDMALQMTKKNKDLEMDRINLEVFNKYTKVLSATEAAELAMLELEKANKDWHITLLTYDAGVISNSLVKQAGYGQKAITAQHEAAIKEVDKAYQELNAILGLNAQDRPILIEEINYKPIEVEDINHTVVRIMDGNPAIWLAEQNAKLADIQLDLYSWTDPMREPYEAKKIDVEKAELSAADAKRQMRDGLHSLYQNLLQVEDNYVALEQGLNVAREDYELKELQYRLGLLSKQDYLAAELDLARAENNFKQIVYQHEAMKRAFYTPWAATM